MLGHRVMRWMLCVDSIELAIHVLLPELWLPGQLGWQPPRVQPLMLAQPLRSASRCKLMGLRPRPLPPKQGSALLAWRSMQRRTRERPGAEAGAAAQLGAQRAKQALQPAGARRPLHHHNVALSRQS